MRKVQKPVRRSPRVLVRAWHLAQRGIVRMLLLYWRFIKWIFGLLVLGILAGGVGGNAMYAYFTRGKFDPIDVFHLPIVLFIEQYPIASLITLVAFAGVTLASLSAHKRTLTAPRPAIRSEYTLQRADRLDPSHYKLFRYLPHVYVAREADKTARKLLHHLANGTDTITGICVIGLPAQGKTRLAWDAMQAELGDRTLVRWPHERQQEFDFAAQGGRRIILWLDDLHEFANPNEATHLNDLPRRFAEADARLVILATCRDGDNYTQAQKYLGSLLERLHIIQLENISASKAVDLAKELTRARIDVHGDEFDGTPGSLVLGIKRMQGRYLHLSEPSKQVLKTMKLLRSARIYTYPETRVLAVARELFGFDEREWRKVCESLDQEHFIKLLMTPQEQRTLEPMSDVYIDKVVTDYPTQHMSLADDWPQLQTCLIQQRDAEGLNNLGVAFAERRLGNQRINKQHAIDCFRSVLQIYTRKHAPADWAMTQNNLAVALRQHAALNDGEQQKHLLQEAIQAFRIALQVRTREHTPDQWAGTQNNLAVALRQQADSFEGEQRKHLLQEAIDALQLALQVRTREHAPADWAMTQNNLATALCDQAALSDGEQQKHLLQEAIEAYQLALQVRTREHAPANWARTQNNLANALCDQAALSDGEQQKHLLQEAIQAYRLALQVYTREYTPVDWAMTQNNLATALGDQANLFEGEEKKRLLGKVIQAYRLALQVRTREHAPANWARTQNNLANALGDQANLFEGEERKRLFTDAIQAYQNALQIHTREYAPSDWATTQNNLAATLRQQATLFEGKEQKRLLQEAIQAYQNALLVRTREHTPGRWRQIQLNIARIYIQMSSLAENNEEKHNLLQEAQKCVDAVLSTTTGSELSQYRADAMELSQAIAKALHNDASNDEEEEEKR